MSSRMALTPRRARSCGFARHAGRRFAAGRRPGEPFCRCREPERELAGEASWASLFYVKVQRGLLLQAVRQEPLARANCEIRSLIPCIILQHWAVGVAHLVERQAGVWIADLTSGLMRLLESAITIMYGCTLSATANRFIWAAFARPRRQPLLTTRPPYFFAVGMQKQMHRRR